MIELTAEQLTTLRNEIQTDPLERGYAGKPHDEIARMLRHRDRLTDRETLGAGMLVANITAGDYVSLSTAAKDFLRLIAAAGEMPMTATLKANLAAMFPANSTTRANVLAAMRRDGTRLEELGLPNVTESDVANALRGK